MALTKSWYKSDTIRGIAMMVVGMALNHFGFVIDEGTASEISTAIGVCFEAIGAVWAAYGRVKATHRLKK